MARIPGLFGAAWLLGLGQGITSAAASGYVLTNAFPGLALTNPVCISSPPNETNRLFIVEKRGRVIVITNLATPTRAIFLDLNTRVSSSFDDTAVGDELGLMGMVFHPGYATNGYFYLFYTGNAVSPAGTGLHDILSRFKVSASDSNQGDSASEIRYMIQFDRAGNHNGSDLHFGADGYLYFSLADEGQAHNTYGNAQIIDRNFFSAIARVDVDNKPGSLTPNPHPALPSLTNYSIPPDNPYLGVATFNGSPVNVSGVRTEFWAVGMRNPWRFCFDAGTGTLYLGQVGQDLIEWVNIVTKGANCGWSFCEGSLKWSNSIPAGFVFTPPLIEYGHTNGRGCVIGGIVYRGQRMPPLYGAYLYADYSSGEIWALRQNGGVVTQNSLILSNASARFTTFGEDPSNGDPLCAEARGGTNSVIERILYLNPPPCITDVNISGTNLVLHGINGRANQMYYVLATSNLTMGMFNWERINTGLFDPNGNFAYTNGIASETSSRFYRIEVP